MSKNGWFSTAQAPNARPVSDVSNALQAINNKLDMILDALTKPEENSEAKSTIDLFRAYDANTMQPVEFKPEEPRRMSGDPAKEQVAGWIIEQYRTMAMFALAAKNGLVKAKVSLKRKNAPDTHRYTHQLEIIAKDRKRKDGRPLAFRPSLFGITEAREVVAYLESLGVKVNTNALNRV